MKNQWGYSLLEVMVALAVLAFSATLVTNNMSKSTALAKGQGDAEKVRDVITRARNLARFQLKCASVDVQADHIDLQTWDSCMPLAGPGAVETIPFESGIVLAQFDTGNPLVFNTQGGTIAGAPSTMIASIPDGKIYEYTVMPAIGSLSMR